MKYSLKKKQTQGFTLIEVVVAMALVALLLTGSLGLMAVSATRIDKALSKVEAEQIVQTVVKKLNRIDFAEAADLVGNVTNNIYNCNSDAGNAVLVYSYSGSMIDNAREYDGSPFTHIPDFSNDVLGVDYHQFSICRVRGLLYDYDLDGVKDRDENDLMFGDDQVELRTTNLSSPIYLIKFRPYHNTTNGLELQDYEDNVFTVDNDPANNVSMTFQMEVYKLRNSNYEVIRIASNSNIMDPTTYANQRGFTRPVYREQITISR